jgi:hypothetical protein
MTEVLEPEPVFVDRTGRRRRLTRKVGIAIGCLLTVYLAVVAFGLAGGAGAPMTPWPAPKPSHRAVPPRHGQAATRQDTPQPEAKPTPSTSRSPRVRPSGSAPATTRTTAPAAASTAHPGQGRAYGRAKSPNPRKP